MAFTNRSATSDYYNAQTNPAGPVYGGSYLGPLSTKALGEVFKTVYYDQHELTKSLYKKSPILGMIPKGSFAGRSLHIPFKLSESKGIGRQFETMFKNVTDSTDGRYGQTYTNMNIDVDMNVAVWAVDMDQKLRSKPVGKYSYIDIAMNEVNSVGHAFSLNRINQFFKDGSGETAEIGDVSSGATSKVITLKNPADVRYLLGEGLQFNVKAETASGSGALAVAKGALRKNAGGTRVYNIDKMNETTGEITLVGGIGAAGEAPIAGDKIYYQTVWRDAATIGAGRTNVMMGLENYCPAVPSTNLYGLDQSKNPGRLTGTRFSKANLGTGGVGALQTGTGPIGTRCQIMIKAMAYQRRIQAKAKYFTCNAETFTDICIELGSGVRYDRGTAKSGTATIGFDYLRFIGPGGPVRLMEENVIYNNIVWGFNPGDFKIVSLGRFISPWAFDGKQVDRFQGRDMLYGIIHSRAQLICAKPKNIIRIDVTP